MSKSKKDLNQITSELRDFLISSDDIELGKKIGEGGFGEVFIATHVPTGKRCAVKLLYAEELKKRDIIDFTREVEVLANCDNLFLLPFYGFTQSIPLMIATEYIPNGSLFNALRHRKGAPILTGTHKTIISLGIAHGMASLHSKGIIHRDLKSLNILLDSNLLPKICDFGVSRIVTDEKAAMTQDVGTPHWMAPELFGSTNYTNKVDVYAFGILLWEMLTETGPFKGKAGYQIALAVCTKKERPAFPDHTPKELKKFISICWHQDPAKRPSFEKIIKILESQKVMFPQTDKSALDLLRSQIRSDDRYRKKHPSSENPPLKFSLSSNKNSSASINSSNNNSSSNASTCTGSPSSSMKSMSLTAGIPIPKPIIETSSKKTSKAKRSLSPTVPYSISNAESNALPEPDYATITKIDDPNFKRNFKSCIKNLSPENSSQFFADVAAAFNSPMSKFVVTQVDRVIRTNVQIFQLFIKSGLLMNLPLNSDENISASLSLILYTVRQRPDVLVNDLLQYISPVISKESAKIICILTNALKVFDRLPNGWDISDFMLQQQTFQNFIDSDSAISFLRLLNFMIISYQQFKSARMQYVYNVLLYALSANDTAVIHSSYSIFINFFSPEILIPEEILNKHIQICELVNDVVNYLLLQKSIPLSQQIISHIIKTASYNRESYALFVSSCDRPHFISTLLNMNDSWLIDGTIEIEKCLCIILGIMAFKERRLEIAEKMANLPLFLIKLVHQTNSVEMIDISISITTKCCVVKDFIDKLYTKSYFADLVNVLQTQKNLDLIKACMLLVDTYAKAGFNLYFLEFIPLIIATVKEYSQLSAYVTHAALTALASLCCNTKEAVEVAHKNGVEEMLKEIQIVPQYEAAISVLQKELCL